MDEKKKHKLLIIDDDPFILEMYVLKFKEEGFIVETAKEGKEGLRKIREMKPDLVFLDVVMPMLDGLEMLRELRKNKETQNMKIVLLTNLGQKDDVERGMKLGADDYIIKAHFTPSEVVAKARSILSSP
jgi:DNA-binding response OmpR family regulator